VSPPGSAPEPVLLLHGQPGSADDWTRLLEAFDGRVVALAIDRPGWDGRSAPTGLAGNAEAAAAALDAAGIERATVVGHSFGGGVAAWLAVNRGERVSRLVLAAPAANCASLTEVDRALALPLITPVSSTAMLVASGLALGTSPLRRRLATRLGIDEPYLRSVAHMLLTPAVWRAFAYEQRALVSELPILERQLHRIRAETVIVEGTSDRVVPLRAARALAAQIPGAELVLLGRAGHLLPHLHAERLAAIILGGGVPGAMGVLKG
jgi:pimeloyl-ACP methyl ester carboxylesterase